MDIILPDLYAQCKNPPSLKDWRRFWTKVDIRTKDECWIWTAGTHGKNRYGSYGLFKWNNRHSNSHRVLTIWLKGDLHDLVVDHQCNVKLCTNPAHLRPCTQKDNIFRQNSPPVLNAQKTHCKWGHPLSGDNLVPSTEKRRRCRICRDITNAKTYAKIVAKQLQSS